ncbi:rRNA methyltransferase [Luteimonas yindakuii]|uniref:rRNA methyltransferase n=1 Tax=Luteimonas yindakuii TaxID=2565782 RepID=A0A4Z1R4A0_9GAMM|nr:TrmH family RNA methyltransferase [Luteimonas yindakuii]TKS53365.1 rRNA methyltransferase [Luteimonas yindakuii]
MTGRGSNDDPGPWRRGPRRQGDAPADPAARGERTPPRGDRAPWPGGRTQGRDDRPAPRRDGPRPASTGRTDTSALEAPPPPRGGRGGELRLHGFNAVQAVFASRPEAIRKVYLNQSRIPHLQPLLKWCVAQRVGYRVVTDDELGKLAASAHHEGVVADVLRPPPLSLADWLPTLEPGPQCLLWLDGVGNPHNFGAILRSAAHFGVAAVLLAQTSTLSLSGAAARVAEGGAEVVPLVRLGPTAESIPMLRAAGFELAATVVREGRPLFAATASQRLVYVLGAEGEGMDAELAAACDLRVSIPGTGAVDSLNVASATAVLLAHWAATRGN